MQISSFCLLAGLLDINGLKIMRTLIYKIPPALPFPKGGIMPLFGGEGCGEIFRIMSIQL
jgi:F0F1-type ATP synthase beta subunit